MEILRTKEKTWKHCDSNSCRTSDVARQFRGSSFLLLTSYFSIFPLRSNRFSLREFAARQMLRSRRLSEFRRDPIISPLILFPGTEVPGYFLFVAMRRRAPPDLSDSLQPDIRRRLFLPEVKQPLCVDCSGAQTWTRKPGKPLLECWRCARSICRLPRCTGKMTVIHGLPPDLHVDSKGKYSRFRA